jgi:RND family efflux transporter MFP subunit
MPDLGERIRNFISLYHYICFDLQSSKKVQLLTPIQSLVKYTHLLLLGFAIFLLEACGGSNSNSGNNQGSQNQNRRRAVSVEVTPVSRGVIADEIKTYGTIQASDIVAVSPQVSNRVTRIFADIGDTVRAGQVLAKIYDATFRDLVVRDQAQVRQSRLAFSRDSSTYERQRTLFEKKLISEADFQLAQTQFESSRSALDASVASLTQNEESLINSEIRSPVYGVVVRRNIAVGVVAGGGTAAFEIANLSGLESRLFIPVRDWERVRVGHPVSFRLSGDSREAARGVVSRISPQIDPVTGLGEVVVSLTDRGSGIFQGALTEATVRVSTRDNVVVIPRTAMIENVQTVIEPESNTIRLNRTYSAFVVSDSTAVRRQLTLGIQMGDRIEILAGLQDGDMLVTTGMNQLDDNTLVRVAQGAPRPSEGRPIDAVNQTAADTAAARQARPQNQQQRAN